MDHDDSSIIAASDKWFQAQRRETAALMRNDLQEAMVAVEEVALRWARNGYLELRTFKYEYDPSTGQHEKRQGRHLTESEAAARIAVMVREIMTQALDLDHITILVEQDEAVSK